ncbi:nucleotide-sugar transmembrane transporter [Anaeramoeba flamelloides]|uniref:Nucleotide-sugar transmembrane transporter n=1 Tax=Anaeramoeba flamelloides TaxID=1746091 RepID=A0AAV8AEV2_9EUKA|nr:nucleotide-sugar transmembrane transporter [Anaeramoeba flamelloides]
MKNQAISKKAKLFLFALYIGIYVSVDMLIKASQKGENSEYDYDPVCAILMTEVVKLVASLLIYFRMDPKVGVKEKFNSITKITPTRLMYGLPALIYAFYNILAYYNLQNFDPPLKTLVLNLRLGFTAFLAWLILKQKISRMKFFSLVILFVGIIMGQQAMQHATQKSEENVDLGTEEMDDVDSVNSTAQKSLFVALFFLILQAFLSSFASIVNEFVFKKNYEESIHLQNSLFYVWGIVINIVCGLILHGTIPNVFKFLKNLNVLTVSIVLTNAIGGLSAASLLKYLSSLTKSYCAVVGMFISTFLSGIFFNTPIPLFFLVGAVLISVAIVIYTKSSQKNKEQNNQKLSRNELKTLKRI